MTRNKGDGKKEPIYLKWLALGVSVIAVIISGLAFNITHDPVSVSITPMAATINEQGKLSTVQIEINRRFLYNKDFAIGVTQWKLESGDKKWLDPTKSGIVCKIDDGPKANVKNMQVTVNIATPGDYVLTVEGKTSDGEKSAVDFMLTVPAPITITDPKDYSKEPFDLYVQGTSNIATPSGYCFWLFVQNMQDAGQPVWPTGNHEISLDPKDNSWKQTAYVGGGSGVDIGRKFSLFVLLVPQDINDEIMQWYETGRTNPAIGYPGYDFKYFIDNRAIPVSNQVIIIRR